MTTTYADTDNANVVPFLKEMHSGQLRIAERFVTAYADQLLYVHGIGWHQWCGTHWIEDKDGEARRSVVALLKDLRHESVELPAKDRDSLIADVKKCESSGGITGVLEIAKHLRPMTVAAEEINAAAHLFNVRNGTYNLLSGEMQPHDPRDTITKCAGTEMVPGARSELWDTFLETVLPDPEVRGYLRRVFGVALLGKVREHTLPILTGTGGNGKSVCIDAVLAAFGDYGITVDPKLIMKTRHERHGTFLADLHGARLVVTSETDEGDVIAAATVKRLTGGDKIRANRMRENPFEFEPSHSLIYVTNHKPQVSADDKAMWRRLAVVPFDVTVTEPDVKLPEKLKGELPAVISWVVHGWLDYLEQGLNPPAAIVERTESYRSDSDPLSQFLDEQCTVQAYAKVKATALHEAWAVWSMKQGYPPMNQKEFGTRMADRGHEKKRGTGGAYQYVGIGLAADEDSGGGLPL
ncbi:phage/plasmid primase, P4 family [Amycolatopsis sp. NPDC049253]|uniref:DNA primase family protein n=1 Tax=Amycolatopsis sp. NPDC049253 TaxID=3155274 RepID=UPI003427DCEF